MQKSKDGLQANIIEEQQLIEVENMSSSSFVIEKEKPRGGRREDRNCSMPVKETGRSSNKITASSNKDTKKNTYIPVSMMDLEDIKIGNNGPMKSFSLSRNEFDFVDLQGPISAEIFFSVKQIPISEVYELGKTLGEGSFGKVRLGVHKRTKMARAVKIIKKTDVMNEDRNQLLKEVAILKSIDHPNIIKIYDMFEDATNFYLVME